MTSNGVCVCVFEVVDKVSVLVAGKVVQVAISINSTSSHGVILYALRHRICVLLIYSLKWSAHLKHWRSYTVCMFLLSRFAHSNQRTCVLLTEQKLYNLECKFLLIS